MNVRSDFLRARGLLILICGFFMWACILTLPCWGESVDSNVRTLTLKAENLPLKDILKKISHATGSEITVNPPWAEVPLTVNINNLKLDEALKKILRVLGGPSNFIVSDEDNKKVTLLISGFPSGELKTWNKVAAFAGNKTTNPEDTALSLSSQSQNRFITPHQLQAIKEKIKNKREKLTKDAVIGPPSMSGGPELTLGELEAVREKQKKKMETLPKETVIGPPSTSGGSGLTLGQLEALKTDRQKKQRSLTLDTAIGPPSMSGGPGLTIGQLEIIKKQYKEKRNAQPEIMIIKLPSGSGKPISKVGK